MEKVNIWSETLLTIMTTLWAKLAGFLPNLVGAILLLVVGYFISRMVGFILAKGLERTGFNKLSEKVGVAATLTRANITLSVADIVGKLAFWIIMLTFLVTATETLGLPRVSETIDEFVLYLPKVIAAALILIIGLFVAHFVRDLIRSGAEGIGVEYAKPLSSAVYGILFVVIVSLSIGQLEVDTGLLDNVISILIGAIGIAAALSLGLGTRDLAANILAGVYARDLYSAGDQMQVEDVEGTLDSIGTVKTQIQQHNGALVSVSNKSLIDAKVSVMR
ncbi:mechanosensitive ion channel family protein [Teredinibacter franksiae]|uniref:mechanosensitive ion channel family protein n=1 Tax=Teredinibacter franksiae TaxID=2761453 RepID=UPI0016281D51|nr:mechanosensitive ion channel domain-containing protein [Teredinibacter franksiae]